MIFRIIIGLLLIGWGWFTTSTFFLDDKGQNNLNKLDSLIYDLQISNQKLEAENQQLVNQILSFQNNPHTIEGHIRHSYNWIGENEIFVILEK